MRTTPLAVVTGLAGIIGVVGAGVGAQGGRHWHESVFGWMKKHLAGGNQ
jgi:hypothetical protein